MTDLPKASIKSTPSPAVKRAMLDGCTTPTRVPAWDGRQEDTGLDQSPQLEESDLLRIPCVCDPCVCGATQGMQKIQELMHTLLKREHAKLRDRVASLEAAVRHDPATREHVTLRSRVVALETTVYPLQRAVQCGSKKVTYKS